MILGYYELKFCHVELLSLVIKVKKGYYRQREYDCYWHKYYEGIFNLRIRGNNKKNLMLKKTTREFI